jgi:hypothetical protein
VGVSNASSIHVANAGDVTRSLVSINRLAWSRDIFAPSSSHASVAFHGYHTVLAGMLTHAAIGDTTGEGKCGHRRERDDGGVRLNDKHFFHEEEFMECEELACFERFFTRKAHPELRVRKRR